MFELSFSQHPPELLRANVPAWNLTYSLLQFCQLHNHMPYQEQLSQCLLALENGERYDAMAFARSIPIGGNGCFNDVFIEPNEPHEDEIIAQTCFEALLSCWSFELRKPQQKATE